MFTRHINRFQVLKAQAMSRRALLLGILRSRFVQVLVAFAALGVCIFAGYALWNGRDLFTAAIVLALLVFGVHLTMELLPVPDAVRSRWVRHRELSDRFISYRFRAALWVGFGFAIPPTWNAVRTGIIEPQAFLVPGIFIGVGLLAHLVWRMRRREPLERDRNG